MAAFCTQAQLTVNNMELADVVKHPEFNAAWWTSIIEDTSDWVQGVLYNTQGTIQDVPNTQQPIQDLTIYACMEMALIRSYSQFRSGDSTDILYWKERKDTQLEGILSHRISCETMVMPVIESAKDDDALGPQFGWDKYGQRIKTDDISDRQEWEADYPYEDREE